MIEVDTDESTAQCKAMIKLGGQYSTLSRSVYLKDWIDPSIDPLYGKKLWSEETDELVSFTSKSADRSFPFKHTFLANFNSTNRILVKQGALLEFKPSDLINPVLPNIDCKEKRTLDIYPDFMGADTYSIILKFDHEVDVKDEEIENVNIENDFGQFIYSVQQLDPKSVKVSSYYAVKSAVLPYAELEQFCSIREKIQNSLSSNIQFKIVQ